MDRRNFLRSMLGVAAATALPSEVFPFRKIFLPPAPKFHNFSYAFVTRNGFVTEPSPYYGISYSQDVQPYTFLGLPRLPYPGRLPPNVLCVLRVDEKKKEIWLG